MKKRMLLTNKGMTLIEIIIALALIGIISIVMLTAYTTGIYLAVRSGDRTKNVSAASSNAENILGNTITYTKDKLVDITVKFKGSDSNKRILTDVEKIIINTEKETVKNNTLETEIEVYKP